MVNATFYVPVNMTIQDFSTGDISETHGATELVIQSEPGEFDHYVGSFTYGAGGAISGTINEYFGVANGTREDDVTGMNISVATYESLLRTNQAQLLAQIFSGNDSIIGSGGDTIFGFTGNDTISESAGVNYVNGNAGDDSLTGGSGRDSLMGGQGNDTIHAGSGTEYLFGNMGNDSIIGGTGTNTAIYGGQGNDTIIVGNGGSGLVSGDKGNDSMVGSAHAATIFYFNSDSNSGADTITGFKTGTDKIEFTPNIDGITLSSFADINSRMTTVNGNAVMDLGDNNSITIVGHPATDLHASDFMIV